MAWPRPFSTGITAVVAEFTNVGADHVLVTVGDSRAVEMAMDLVRAEDNLVIVGMPSADATVPLPVFGTVVHSRRILGSIMGSTRLAIDIPRLIGLYRAKRLKLDELITGRYPFEQINEAIESSEHGDELRNLVVFDQSSALV